jgi:aconitate hydratase
VLALLGDSVTTDHISPAGSIKPDSPAGRYLAEHGIERKDFNSYGSRRGNHEVMIRGTFAKHPAAQPAARRRRGRLHAELPRGGEQTTIYDAAQAYAAAGVPLVVLAGKEYGSGSSRDWAAKGTALLGVRVVIAESFERIHRSNLIGMGVLPLQFPAARRRESLGLDGTETFDVTGVTALNDGTTPRTVAVTATEDDGAQVRSTPSSGSTPRRGGLLPQRRHPAVRAAAARPRLTREPTRLTAEPERRRSREKPMKDGESGALGARSARRGGKRLRFAV